MSEQKNAPWKYCFYCGTHKPSAEKRPGFKRNICNECVSIRHRTKGETK